MPAPELVQTLNASQLRQYDDDLRREYRAGAWTGAIAGGLLVGLITYFIVREPKKEQDS